MKQDIRVTECTTCGDDYRYVDITITHVPLNVRTVDLVTAVRDVLHAHGVDKGFVLAQ